MVDPVKLHAHGALDQASLVCDNFYFGDSDRLARVLFRYNSVGVTHLTLATVNGQNASFGTFNEQERQYAREFTEDAHFFFGFMSVEEYIEEGEGGMMLVGLGIVSYHYECLRDERMRLGGDFTWGIEVADDPSSTTTTNKQEIIIDVSEQVAAWKEAKRDGTDANAGMPEVDFISEKFDFMEDLEAWQRYIAYLTFGANFLFLLCLLIWCCCRCKCCCGGRAAEIRKFHLKLLNRQSEQMGNGGRGGPYPTRRGSSSIQQRQAADDSARVELAKQQEVDFD